MKRLMCITGLFLFLLVAAVPANAATTTTITSDTISAISPNAGQAGKTVAVTITGNNFTNTQGSVRLEKSGETDIKASISSWSTTQIACSFKFSSSTDTGKWDLVVVKGFDSTVIEKDDMFTVTSPMKLSSISPKSAQAGDDDVDFTITGSNLDDIEDVYLYNNDYKYNITADDVDAESSTKVKGTFDLEDIDDFDTFEVCVVDKNNAVECALSFEIISNEVGSLDISSDPSGASILIDGIANGTTPNNINDLVVGSHKVVLRKTGYSEWGKVVNIKADETYEIDARLYESATATPTEPPTNAPTYTQYTTPRTTAKTTIKIPTPIPTANPTTEASPLDPVTVLAAAGIGCALVASRHR